MVTNKILDQRKRYFEEILTLNIDHPLVPIVILVEHKGNCEHKRMVDYEHVVWSTCGPLSSITFKEVAAAITKMRNDKVVVPDEIPSEF